MSTPLSVAMAQSGVLDEDMLSEFIKWKLPLDLPSADKLEDPIAVVNAILEAIEDGDQVRTRQTDLDILKQYLETQKTGKLHVVTSHESGTFPVEFGKTKSGEYIIPWRGDSLEEVMTNGETYLKDSQRKIYFNDVKELFFGDVKAFMICTPSAE